MTENTKEELDNHRLSDTVTNIDEAIQRTSSERCYTATRTSKGSFNLSFRDDMGESIYDRADSITWALSKLAVADLSKIVPDDDDSHASEDDTKGPNVVSNDLDELTDNGVANKEEKDNDHFENSKLEMRKDGEQEMVDDAPSGDSPFEANMENEDTNPIGDNMDNEADKSFEARMENEANNQFEAKMENDANNPCEVKIESKDNNPFVAKMEKEDNNSFEANTEKEDNNPFEANMQKEDNNPFKAKMESEGNNPFETIIKNDDNREPVTSSESPHSEVINEQDTDGSAIIPSGVDAKLELNLNDHSEETNFTSLTKRSDDNSSHVQ